MRLRPRHLTKRSFGEEDLAALNRAGGSGCEAIGLPSVLSGSGDPFRNAHLWPDDPKALVGWFCKRRHPAQENRLEEAIAVASRAERVHRSDDAWPHGLSDHLSHILDRVFAHQQREQAVVFPMLLEGVEALSDRTVDEMIEAHEGLLTDWRAVSRLTGGFSVPAHACATWRRLYALCTRLQSDCVEQVGLENRMLLAGRAPSPPG